MSICNSCGGVIGRDCFNPSECAWISESMAQQAAQQNNAQDEQIRSLELRCAELEQELENYRPVAEAKGATKAISQRDAALAQVSELTARIAELEGTLDFIRDECHWEVGDSDQPFGGGDERIGPAIDDVFARVGKLVSRIQQEAQDPKDLVKQIDSLRAQLTEARKDGQWLPVSEAPDYVDGIELARMLVYSTDFGITIGQVVKWPDGSISKRVEGQGYEWNITHFKYLPAMPLPESKEAK